MSKLDKLRLVMELNTSKIINITKQFNNLNLSKISRVLFLEQIKVSTQLSVIPSHSVSWITVTKSKNKIKYTAASSSIQTFTKVKGQSKVLRGSKVTTNIRVQRANLE